MPVSKQWSVVGLWDWEGMEVRGWRLEYGVQRVGRRGVRDGDRVSHRKYLRFSWDLWCIPHVYTFTGKIKHGGSLNWHYLSTIQIM